MSRHSWTTTWLKRTLVAQSTESATKRPSTVTRWEMEPLEQTMLILDTNCKSAGQIMYNNFILEFIVESAMQIVM